ncbi:hypothetical protein HXA35_15235 [Bacillus sp. A301a_S52]|jgi:uncharacterized protein YhdP|nr:hypothetical protein [Bacillus sp. A301a_S52]
MTTYKLTPYNGNPILHVRNIYDWKGHRGIELSLTHENITVFAHSFQLALKDLEEWYLLHRSEESYMHFKSKTKEYMIEPAMTWHEKKRIDDSLVDWISTL